MNWCLAIAFLFCVGSLLGWCLEFVFRNLISHKGPRGRFFINPGFCRGPYLPIYGVGLTVMFLLSYFLEQEHGAAATAAIIFGIGVCMTVIEFIGGFLLLHVMNIRLWDYRKFKGNILGFVCPRFSLIWMAIGALYYLFIHVQAIDWLIWLSKNLAFSFAIGLFYGIFVPDMINSSREAMVIREFAQDEQVIVKYEELKQLVQEHRLQNAQKARFFNQTAADDSGLVAFLTSHKDSISADKK